MSAVSRKAINLAPTALVRPTGVPVARALNLGARASASSHDHGHGAAGPRADAPARWAATHSVGPFGLTAASRVNGASSALLRRATGRSGGRDRAARRGL